MGSKTSEQRCALEKQSSQMCSSPTLENHWLVPMGAEVGASVASLPHARRV